MILWILLLIFIGTLGLGALFYLVTRVRRFSFMRELSTEHKALSWLLAIAAVGLLFLFAFVNLYAVVIVVLHLALIWLICDLVAWIMRRVRKTEPKRYLAGVIALLLTTIYLGAGWIAAHHIRQTNYIVESEKTTESLRIVLIADSHLGITLDGDGFKETMEWIQSTGPDLVVAVGDFVDDDSNAADLEAACRALGSLQTTYGVYFVYGNHDNGYFAQRDFTAADLRTALTQNGVTILEDETVLLGDQYALIGRKDRSMPDRLPFSCTGAYSSISIR